MAVLLFDNLSVKLQFDDAGQQTEVCWTFIENFFSKTVIQGQNVAINLIIAAFILYHRGAVQERNKRYKKKVLGQWDSGTVS